MRGPSRLVLLVEDDGDLRQAVAELIEDQGYACRHATNGIEALAALNLERPDLLHCGSHHAAHERHRSARAIAGTPVVSRHPSHRDDRRERSDARREVERASPRQANRRARPQANARAILSARWESARSLILQPGPRLALIPQTARSSTGRQPISVYSRAPNVRRNRTVAGGRRLRRSTPDRAAP